MLGIESKQKEMTETETKYYLNLIDKNVPIEDIFQMVYADGWYVGYEACLSEGCEEEDEEDW